MLTFGYGGTDTPHAVGCVCEHVNDYYWYIAQHQTAYAYDINGKTYDGTLGEIMIIPPGDFMHHTNQKGADIGFVDDYMYFAGEEVEKMVERLKLPVSIAFYSSDHKLIDPYIKQLKMEEHERKLGYEYRVSGLIYDMLVKMARQYEEMISTTSPQKRLLDSVRQEMLKNIEKKWTLGELAKLGGYSPAYFCSLYNKYYNMTPLDELLNYRITIAKQELLKKELSVTEISQKCGFLSIHHFSRYFKKLVGVSPSAFCKKKE